MRIVSVCIVFLLSGLPAFAQSANDGRLLDAGRTLTERSPSAPDLLNEMANYIGQWDVEITRYPTDSTTYTTTGQADVTLMNRGWSYMERLHVEDFDGEGHANDEMAFLTVNRSSGRFEYGIASSYTEQIMIFDGELEANRLVLTSAVRQRGVGTVTVSRMTFSFESANELSVLVEESTDLGQSWSPSLRKEISRRRPSDTFMAVRDDYGQPTTSRSVEAGQFDFLIGEWTANHNILLGGNWVQFPSNSSAVFVMGGHAILEHDWYNIDSSHPEAATSIIRLYNRAERRWESLYLNNRGNSLLHFGGVWEGDRLVLHSFNTNLTDTISRWVFHTIEPDRYQWSAEVSTDRGETFNETAKIDAVRK